MEAKEKWGDTAAYQEYQQKTAGYTDGGWQRATEGLNAIFAQFASCKKMGNAPESPEAMALVKQLQDHITQHYYTCTDQILFDLGLMYVADERFKATIDRQGEGTAAFASEAIKMYLK